MSTWKVVISRAVDKHQLVALAIAALFGAIAKELIGGMVSLVKTSSAVGTAKTKIKNSRALIGDFIWLVAAVAFLLWELSDKTPVTRLDVLRIEALSLAVLVSCIAVGWRLIGMSIQRKREKASPPSTP
jgi:hypothetical protein